jgi:hypothetical protein
MRFTPWYPLAEASCHAPSGPGVYQLRVRSGLRQYPTGKSAMVRYGFADELQACLGQLASEPALAELLCRHGEELSPAEAADPRAALVELERAFERRFGSQPSMSNEAG